MADEALAASAPPRQVRKFIGPDGEVVTPATDEEAYGLQAIGYSLASAEQLTHAAVLAEISNPVIGFLSGATKLPFVRTALTSGARLVKGDAYAATMARAFLAQDEANPKSTLAGQVAANVGLGVAGASAGSAATALGGSTAAKVGAYAGEGAILGAGGAVDNEVLQYAASGRGTENFYSELGTAIVGGAFFNVGLGVGVPKLATGLKSKAASWNEGLLNTADKIETNQLLSKRGQEVLLQRGQLGNVANFISDNNLKKMKPELIPEYLKTIKAESWGALKEARYGSNLTLSLASTHELARDLQDMMTGLNPSIARPIDKILRKGNLSAENLHNMRMNLDKHFSNFDAPQSKYSQQISGMRDLINDRLETLLAAAEDKTLLPTFQKANRNFNAAKNLLEYAKQEGGKSFWRTVAGSLGNAAGWSTGGFAGSVIAGAAADRTAQVLNTSKAAAGGLRFLAKTLGAADTRFGNALIDGLQNKGGSEALTEMVFPRKSYPMIVATAKHAVNMPMEHIQKFTEAAEKAGLPGKVIDQLVPQHMAAMQYLAGTVPQSPFIGQTVSPEAYKPTAKQQNDFMERANAVFNPAAAIAKPTPVQLETLKATYPNTMQALVQTAMNHAAGNASLSRRSKAYAARLSGMSASPASTPAVQVGLALLVKQAQEKAMMQARAAQSNGGSGVASSVQSDTSLGASRVERLSR